MDTLSILLGILVIWTLVQCLRRPSRTCKLPLPPGPTPLPVVGNLLKLGDKPHKSLADLAKTYGPIMTLKLGQKTTVVISSPAMAKQVLQKQDAVFSTRAIPDSTRIQDHHRFSVAWLPAASTPWRKLRKICNSYIFSVKKLDANQHLRRQKVQELVEEVRESCEAGIAVEIGGVAFRTSLNLLSNTIFSVDFADSKSEIAGELKELIWSILKEVGKPNLVDFFPVLEKIDPQGIRGRVSIYFAKISKMIDRLIDQRLELRKSQGYLSSDDVLDTLLNISEDDSDDAIDRTWIMHLFMDLFIAGTDTTTSTTEWAMAEILRDPKILSKAQAELEQTIGKGKQIEESDITQLPYLQAIIKETMRLHPTGPLLLPRQVDTDVEVCGFIVPKGAQVQVNVWTIGRDPSIWENPNSFIPERFLGSKVDVRGQDFELIPFGAGRRICPGMSLATRMVPLMLGSLINSFNWKLEDGIAPEDMDMDDKFGLSLQKAQPLRAVPLRVFC